MRNLTVLCADDTVRVVESKDEFVKVYERMSLKSDVDKGEVLMEVRDRKRQGRDWRRW